LRKPNFSFSTVRKVNSHPHYKNLNLTYKENNKFGIKVVSIIIEKNVPKVHERR